MPPSGSGSGRGPLRARASWLVVPSGFAAALVALLAWAAAASASGTGPLPDPFGMEDDAARIVHDAAGAPSHPGEAGDGDAGEDAHGGDAPDEASHPDSPVNGPALEHGLASGLSDLLQQADGALPPTLRPPVWPHVGPDGADVVHRGGEGWPLLGGEYLLGGDEPAPVWPCTWDWMGWGVCGDHVALPPVLEDSTDNMLARQLRKAGIVCQAVQERVGAPLPDCAVLLRELAQALLPDVHYHTDLESVTVTVNDPAPLGDGPSAARASDVAVGAGRAVLWGDAAPARASVPHGLLQEDPTPAGGPAHLPLQGLADPFAAHAAFQAVPAAAMLAPAVALVLGALALALPALALYRRILAHRTLDHPLRAALMRLVRAAPGIHESEVARRMGLRHTHVQYHIRVLEEAGLLETRSFGGLKCLFELGRHSPADKARALARHGRTSDVLDALASDPGATQRVLARSLGMSESSLKWHLDRLEASGYVRTERMRGAKRSWLTPEGRSACPSACGGPGVGPQAAPAAIVAPPAGGAGAGLEAAGAVATAPRGGLHAGT